MALTAIRSALAEPAAPDPPGPRTLDWLLVGVLGVAAVVEGALLPELVWRPVTVVATVALTLTLPWRRIHPLAMLAVAFGAMTVGQAATVVASAGPIESSTLAFILLLPYALARWASGRDVVIGTGLLVVAIGVGLVADWTGLGDALGGVAIVAATMALGVAVRSRGAVRSRELAQIRSSERERLARELHDTVAHHVSAIVVQAQAGRTVASTRPDAAVEALETIEQAGVEALADMRRMVRILRDDGTAAALTPLGGVADLERLAERLGGAPAVRVELVGAVRDLDPAVDAAIFRLVQESLTNVTRHARLAGRVEVRVQCHDAGMDGALVEVRVHDDGDTSHLTAVPESGFGLVGMSERARLLGGSCVAGPDPSGGWTVEARLPVRERSDDGVRT